ncbi:MAG: hypothetical protein IH594_11250 [Bacteroidales bacterium]|nr:hypothetical protein [Bacteroidales bacterium]
MKKVMSILAVVVFFAAISAPVFASENTKTVIVNVIDEEPKKADAKKSGDCTSKAEKSSDCATKAEKSGCDSKKEKSCGDKDKK